ncbi:MAG: thioredoxin family protein [Thermoplasmata archaeon]|nr:MAG: thioredoxin family protein [Thermoplasmata archaeon]
MALFRKRSRGEPPSEKEWPRGTVELDDRSFQGFVDKYPLSVVEFWASWCGPCKTMRPIIRDMAERHRGKVAFGKVNIERHRRLAEAHDVLSIPHLVFISYGQVVGNYHGKMSRRKLEGKIGDMAKRYS